MLPRLLRVKQYSKNLFVLAPLLFAKAYSDPHRVLEAALATLVMCLVGSATYIANDLLDLERDRNHPKKRLRPIASGAISIPSALTIAGTCLAAGLALAYFVNLRVLECAAFYVLLQVLYNGRLKHVAVADVFVIATGFVLRVVIGAAAISAQMSSWILLCSGALALLLGFGKRRSEFLEQGEDRGKSRESLRGYTLQALDACVIASAAGSIMCYGLYGIQSATARAAPALILTIPFVAFGVLRYTTLIFGSTDTSEPESVVIRDPQLIITFLLFVVVAALALTGLVQIDLLD
jgi:4-hydroxybenzoate polyprenyltransferase